MSIIKLLRSPRASSGGGSILVPDGWAGQSDDVWESVANNTLDDVNPTHANNGFGGVTLPDGNGFAYQRRAWCGAALDQTNLIYYVPPGGGHDDYDGNEHYAFDMVATARLWKRLRNPSAATGGHEGTNALADWADGNPRPIHSYNSQVFAKGRLWNTCMPAMAGNTGGPSSTAVYSWAPGETNWTFHGLGIAVDPSGGGSNWTFIEACATYDPVGDKIWVVAGVASAGKSYYSINLAAYPTVTFTEYDQHVDLGRYGWVTCLPTDRILVRASTVNGTMQFLDLTAPLGGWDDLTFSGSPDMVGPDHYQGHFDEIHRRIYGWASGDGSNIRYLTVPANAKTGTYTGGTRSAGGGSATPVTNTDPDGNGTFSKFQYFVAGDGRRGFMLMNDTTGSTWRYKLAA